MTPLKIKNWKHYVNYKLGNIFNKNRNDLEELLPHQSFDGYVSKSLLDLNNSNYSECSVYIVDND